MATDIEAWFAALDRFVDVPFMEAEHRLGLRRPRLSKPLRISVAPAAGHGARRQRVHRSSWIA